jgi:hypothetical protein
VGQRKPGFNLSNNSFRFLVYLPHSLNGGGSGFNVGKCSRGSPTIFRIIQNFSGSSPITGRTLSATGLYFFLVAALASWTSCFASANRVSALEVDS